MKRLILLNDEELPPPNPLNEPVQADPYEALLPTPSPRALGLPLTPPIPGEDGTYPEDELPLLPEPPLPADDPEEPEDPEPPLPPPPPPPFRFQRSFTSSNTKLLRSTSSLSSVDTD